MDVKSEKGLGLYRPALCLLVVLLTSAAAVANGQTCNVTGYRDSAGFLYGVASGDPTSNSVVLWSHFQPQTATPGNLTVNWYLSTDKTFRSVSASGQVLTGPFRDFTLKAIVTGLQPYTQYYYYFAAGNYSSLLGVTKTLPAAGDPQIQQLRFLFTSCSDWGYGYFNLFNLTAQINDLDFVVFLGDWTYEYGTNYYPPPGPVVRPFLLPPTKTTSLTDYRERHRLYQTDLALQEMQRRVPLLVIWDDHDFHDNAWRGGAADFNASTSPISWDQLVENAATAFHEYLPTRQQPHNDSLAALKDIYKEVQFADIATIVMPEERIQYRDKPYDYKSDPYMQALANNPPEAWSSLPNLTELRQSYLQALAAPNRTLIGPQVNRTRQAFSQSTTWQIFANQVIMGPRRTPDIESAVTQVYGDIVQSVLGTLLDASTSQLLSTFTEAITDNARILLGTGRFHDPVIVDGWDGYAYERQQLYDIFQSTARNPVVLAGDSHNAWAYELKNASNASIAVEFDSPSVTPQGFDQLTTIIPGNLDGAEVITRGMFISNPTVLKYANISRRGGVILTMNRTSLHADYFFLSDISTPQLSAFCGVAFDVTAGGGSTLLNGTCTPEAALFHLLYSQRDPLQGYNLSQAYLPSTLLFTCNKTRATAVLQTPETTQNIPVSKGFEMHSSCFQFVISVLLLAAF